MQINQSKCSTLFILTIGIIGWPSALSANELNLCEKVFLTGEKISSFIEREKKQESPDAQYISRLEKIKNCSSLLEMASLKDNGLLKDRSAIASTLLDVFNEFHTKWLMPTDYDRSLKCNDSYQWDIYDKSSPAYHLSRTLFQNERKASMAVTAYGEYRIVRKGEDPTISSRTQKTSQEYKEALGLERELSFSGQGEILGFLYERANDISQFELPVKKNSQWQKAMPFQNEHNIYQHFGAGLLGSPSFLYYHLKEKAHYSSNGKSRLPRKLVDSIFQNLLCSSPEKYFDKKFQNEYLDSFSDKENKMWNHPITKEQNCLKCHLPLDQMAAGLRHLTLIPSQKQCSSPKGAQAKIQVLYPIFLKSTHSDQIWNTPNENESFFPSSYPVGYLGTKKYRSLRELGKLISEDPLFYQCQVKKYYQWIHNKYPKEEVIKELGQRYQDHQNGIKLLNELIGMEKEK